MSHLTFEEISEVAETRTPRADSRAHLESCAECRATLARVERLLAAAQALPREIAPPPEVWGALQARVKASPRTTRARSRSWTVGWLAAAAAVVFFVGAALLLPPSVGKSKGKGAVVQRAPDAGQSPVVLAVAQNYEPTLADLRRTLDQQRGTLSPATLQVIEKAVATCDTAIAEARAALASDPANQALLQILSAQFEHKVELLQRATQLSSS
jgi:predicted anti-sigma-YlaC factor YlaD